MVEIRSDSFNFVVKLNIQMTEVQWNFIAKIAWFWPQPFHQNTHNSDDRAVNWRSRSFKVINFCCNQKPTYEQWINDIVTTYHNHTVTIMRWQLVTERLINADNTVKPSSHHRQDKTAIMSSLFFNPTTTPSTIMSTDYGLRAFSYSSPATWNYYYYYYVLLLLLLLLYWRLNSFVQSCLRCKHVCKQVLVTNWKLGRDKTKLRSHHISGLDKTV